jgi:hypothetical protein
MAMDPKRRTLKEAAAYRTLLTILADLRKTERTLTTVQQEAWDAERALHPAAIRSVIVPLESVIAPDLTA